MTRSPYDAFAATLYPGGAARTVALAPRLGSIGPAVDEALDALGHLRRVGAREGREAAAEEASILRLALTEALNNVVEHSGHPVDRPVLVRVGAEAPWFGIEDRGRPLPEGLTDPVPLGPGPGEAVASPPEGGWGWMLIHASVERVAYRRRDGVNHLLLEGCRRLARSA
jgi:anti-sigma regulatory factor (Ser/Thr protein kinase)